MKGLNLFLSIFYLNKKSGTFIITLDERGEILSSPKLASKLSSVMESGLVKEIIIVIGGPFGLPDELIDHTDFAELLSKAVFRVTLHGLLPGTGIQS